MDNVFHPGAGQYYYPMARSGWFRVGIELSFGPATLILTSHKVNRHFSRAVSDGPLPRHVAIQGSAPPLVLVLIRRVIPAWPGTKAGFEESKAH